MDALPDVCFFAVVFEAAERLLPAGLRLVPEADFRFRFAAAGFFFAANYCLCPISRITGRTMGRFPVVLKRYLETLSRIWERVSRF